MGRSVPQASQQRYVDELTSVQISQVHVGSEKEEVEVVRPTKGRVGCGFVDAGIGGGSLELLGLDGLETAP